MHKITVQYFDPADGDALSTAHTSAEMAAVRTDSATYDVARRVIFAASVEDV
jgi:hypothetical protein